MTTAQQIKDILEDTYTTTDDYGTSSDSGYAQFQYELSVGDTANLHDIDIKLVSNWGGEGEGSSYGFILGVDNQFFRVDGYYESYDGVDWDGATVTEVQPREVTVTKYFAV